MKMNNIILVLIFISVSLISISGYLMISGINREVGGILFIISFFASIILVFVGADIFDFPGSTEAH